MHNLVCMSLLPLESSLFFCPVLGSQHVVQLYSSSSVSGLNSGAIKVKNSPITVRVIPSPSSYERASLSSPISIHCLPLCCPLAIHNLGWKAYTWKFTLCGERFFLRKLPDAPGISGWDHWSPDCSGWQSGFPVGMGWLSFWMQYIGHRWARYSWFGELP